MKSPRYLLILVIALIVIDIVARAKPLQAQNRAVGLHMAKLTPIAPGDQVTLRTDEPVLGFACTSQTCYILR